MTAKQRILALRLLEREKRQPDFAKKIGVEVIVKTSEKKEKFK